MKTKAILWRRFENFVMQEIIEKPMRFWLGFGLILLLAGCQTTKSRDAFFLQESSGNVWALSLPAGTKIVVEDPAVLAPTFNEIHEGVVSGNCVLVSQEYLNRRDEAELQLHALIQELKVKKDSP